MRAYKFRVWDKRLNKFLDDNDSNDGCGLTLDGDFAFCSQSQFGYVDPKNAERYIIQQYTGAKDKNKREIFEGDILKMGNGDIAEVKYNELHTSYHAISPGHVYSLNFTYMGSAKNEVIGNIFENPELAPNLHNVLPIDLVSEEF